MAILSFCDDALAEFYYDDVIPLRAGWAPYSNQVRTKLDKLDLAGQVSDMSQPAGNQLHRLEGNLMGFYSVRINRQWHLVFRWQDGNAFDVNVVDYH